MRTESALNIFAVVRSADVRDALVSAVQPTNGTTLNIEIGQLKAVGNGLNFNDHPDVLLFDIDMDDSDDLETLHQIQRQQANGSTAIIATSEKLTTSAMRRLIRDGIDDFLPQPLSAADVCDTLQAIRGRLRNGDDREESKGSIISFVRAAGGMGATTLAVHTACALTKRKRKQTPKKVCLIDLDVQFGGAGLYLDLESSSALVDIARSPERLDADLLHGNMVCHKSGFDVLTAPTIPVPLDALRAETVIQLLNVAQNEYDYVVIDLPQALTHWTDAVLVRSSLVALVTQLTVPAIRQTRRLLELLQDEGHYTLPMALVLNRYKRQWGGGVHLRQARKALGHDFDYIIPNDYGLVMAALNQGLLTFDIKRRSRFSKAVCSMAETSAKKVAPPADLRAPALAR